jgi:hypothetical protein
MVWNEFPWLVEKKMLSYKVMGIALSAALLSPFGAGASTLSPANDIVSGGTYDMLGSHFYAESFKRADGAGFREFTFTNGNSSTQNLLLTTATVNALSAMFKGGITFEWLGTGASLFVRQGKTEFSDILNTAIGANSSDTLRISFGDVMRRPGASAGGKANFSVELDAMPAAVPLPAAGLMLLSALGGIAALRRRRMQR